MEHSSNLVVFCHIPSPMSTWTWLYSDLYFFIGFRCGSKILSQSIIQDQKSPTNYQWSNLHNRKPWFRKVTHSVEERMEHSTSSVCVNLIRLILPNANEIPETPTRPQVKICALQQQDVISLCSRHITVLLLAVVFINSQHWLLVLNLFIFFVFSENRSNILLMVVFIRGALMKIHSTTITSSLSDQFQSWAKVSLRII